MLMQVLIKEEQHKGGSCRLIKT